MAWLYQRPDSGRWWIGYRQHGTQFLKSTGTSDQEAAQRELAKIEAMLAAQRAGALATEVFHAITGRALPNITLTAALKDWLNEARGATGKRTLEKYNGIASALVSHFKANERGPLLTEITRDQLQQFLDEKRANVTAATTNMTRNCVAIFFKRCRVVGYLRDNPAEGIKKFKVSREEKRVRRPFTQHELATLYSTAPDDFWRYMVLAGYVTGLRMGDLITMPIGAVDWKTHCLRLVTHKTGSTMFIPIGKPLFNLLTRLRSEQPQAQPADPFWPEQARRYDETGAGWFSQRFYDLLLVKAGLAKSRPHRPGSKKKSDKRKVNEVSFHCLRHSCVSSHAANAQNQQVVKALAGHTSDEVNDLYTKLPVEVLKKAVALLPDITTKAKP